MPTQIFEIEASDHLDLETAPIQSNELFTWPEPFKTNSNVISLSERQRPDTARPFGEVEIEKIPAIIGEIAPRQSHETVVMRFLVKYTRNGKADVTFTESEFRSINILANTGHDLVDAVRFYEGKEDHIFVYASGSGYYWICTPCGTHF